MDSSETLISELQEIDYFFLRDYYILRRLADLFPSRSDTFLIIKSYASSVGFQRHILNVIMREMEQGKQLSESHQQIVSKLGIITRLFRTTIEFPLDLDELVLRPEDLRLNLLNLAEKVLRQYDWMLELEENRTKTYLDNISELINAYKPVITEIERGYLVGDFFR